MSPMKRPQPKKRKRSENSVAKRGEMSCLGEAWNEADNSPLRDGFASFIPSRRTFIVCRFQGIMFNVIWPVQLEQLLVTIRASY